MDLLEVVRHVVVLGHITGFAVLFGAWIVEAVSRRVRFTPLMNYGLLLAAVTGLALAAPWGIEWELDYTKIAVKLVILVVIGALLGIGSARQRKRGGVPSAVFWLVGILTFANAAIAVLWR